HAMKYAVIACAIVAFTNSAQAQPEPEPATEPASTPTVVLCEASWMDAERVRALLAVEFGADTAAVRVEVHTCSEVAADVQVRFGIEEGARERANHLDLSQTATGARSRLVALVVAELVRLGPPAVAAVAPAEPALEELAPQENNIELAENETAQTADELVVAEPVVAEPVVAEPVVAEPVVAEPVVAEPVVVAVMAEPLVDDSIDEDRIEVSSAAETSSARCEGWSRFGRGPCSWAITLGYGVALHQVGLLGESREGSAFLHQLRLVGRWRYLFAGVRMYGVGVREVAATNIVAGGATVMFGVEWWARRWSKSVLALRTGLESGVHGFRSSQGSDVCGFECASVGEPTIGAFTSVRYERAFGILRGAIELELGWSRGFRIDLSRELVTGLGGPWLSLNIDLSIGRAE
ncbi:MAG: hypothetical protein ACI9KE_003713, partial [Polyangiales bacterium]